MEEAKEGTCVDEDGGWKMGMNNNANCDWKGLKVIDTWDENRKKWGYKGLKKDWKVKWN